jgi:IS30 family transposase
VFGRVVPQRDQRGHADRDRVGASERDIAERLGISHRTVQKHLERCYRCLGVTNRSRAAAIAWATIDAADPRTLTLAPGV